MYKRLLNLPKQPANSLFLWGPRQTGKTTLLKQTYPDAFRIDLLKSEILMDYLSRPSSLREQVTALPDSQVIVIDEIQKAPELLNEVHYLIQEYDRKFVLCGSSARKVRRGHANLLGGRAIRYELMGLTAKEIDREFNMERALNNGPLPNHYNNTDAPLAIRSYVDDYMREEILQEGLVRRLPVFSDFLRVAAIGDAEIVNLSNIARECGVAASTVRDHYAILTDTLMGAFLPAYTVRPKRRVIQSPKFYFHDVGVVNYLARRGVIYPKSELFGKAFENWLFNELYIHARYSEKFYDISYWRLSTGIEVDFILGNAAVAVEAKGKTKITENDLKGLYQFKKDYPQVKHLIITSMEETARATDHGILILPYIEFINRLWQGCFI